MADLLDGPLGPKQYRLLHWLVDQPGSLRTDGDALADIAGGDWAYHALQALEDHGLAVTLRRRGQRIDRVQVTADGRRVAAAGPDVLALTTRVGLWLAARGPATLRGLQAALDEPLWRIRRTVRRLHRRGHLTSSHTETEAGRRGPDAWWWVGDPGDLPDIPNPYYADAPAADAGHELAGATSW